MRIRLFTSGTHNNLTFSNEEINEIHRLSFTGAGKLPFVIGHPKNDLPIVGWLPKSAIQVYSEGNKTSIGFERNSAEFSSESIDALKKLKKDKISVRLTSGAITHIGLVETAAVAENNDQTFSLTDKTGTLCFSEQFVFEDDKDIIPAWFKKFTDKYFSNNKQPVMEPTEKEKQLQQDLETAKSKISDFEKKEKTEAANKEVDDLKKKVADFENKEKDLLKAELKTKVEGLKLDEKTAKEKTDFGTSLIDKDVDLAKKWIGELQPATVSTNVKQGTVTDNEGKEDFSVKGKPDVNKAAEADAKKQFESLNKK